ncbi:DAK2 domain-containing protein [Rhodococcus antarcticus]|uniref:DAK2 domain-containing protein n=1 Tax=Rhodococcus antarcticus TaxID=2987751 RepID=A0ABY6P2F5_9NOCA|nr:DAK2 domain-containing protein [Rhodococcus antarcticus]UZJ25684.1 DAK2 domain-containing protein [Rhodococcus antarcticus]
MLHVLDADAVLRWAEQSVVVLAAHRSEVDRLNVFPVPDADTGSNLLATSTAALAGLLQVPEPRTAATAAAGWAHGAVLGARGNSGLILAQVLVGIAETLADAGPCTGPVLAAALARADVLATAAVSEPAPGTVLTVLHLVASVAGSAAGADLAYVTRGACAAAGTAVADTTGQLPELAAAGVVDAGARGLELVLAALLSVVADAPLPVPADPATALRPTPVAAVGYEVVYLLSDTDPPRVAVLRAALDSLGDSVVLAGDPSTTVTVHVHARDAGAALEAGLAAGRPHRITVEVLAAVPAVTVGGARRAVLSLVVGAATAALVAGEGSAVLRVDSAVGALGAVRAAIAATGAERVTLLPNGAVDRDVVTEAVAAARDAGQRVTVVPTASAVQGLAALAVHDPTRDDSDDVVAMAEAAAATRRGSVHVATGRGLTWVGQCEPGDVLALVDDDVALIESDQGAACERLLDRMLGGGGELVTVLTGVQAEPGLAERLEEHVRSEHRGVDVVVYPCDLADVVLVLGVE